MKTIMLESTTGEPIEAQELARLTVTLRSVSGRGRNFRFIVTYAPRIDATPVVTHAKTKRRVCRIEQRQIEAARGDYKGAGRLAMAALVDAHGEAKIHDALARAEL